jgi:hypothetical protein
MEGIDPTLAEERLPNTVAEVHQLQQGLDILGRTHGDSKRRSPDQAGISQSFDTVIPAL